MAMAQKMRQQLPDLLSHRLTSGHCNPAGCAAS
jgi:hypothetical protein